MPVHHFLSQEEDEEEEESDGGVADPEVSDAACDVPHRIAVMWQWCDDGIRVCLKMLGYYSQWNSHFS